jgi:hypothetical protein
MRFESKKDGFLWGVSGFVGIIYSGVSILIYYAEDELIGVYSLASIWLVLTIFMIWILPKTTHYTFLEDHLLCQSVGFKKRIPYTTFNKLEPANGLYAGWKMSTAWHCLVLRYNKYDELLISPANETQFIEIFMQKKAQFSNIN